MDGYSKFSFNIQEITKRLRYTLDNGYLVSNVGYILHSGCFRVLEKLNFMNQTAA